MSPLREGKKCCTASSADFIIHFKFHHFMFQQISAEAAAAAAAAIAK